MLVGAWRSLLALGYISCSAFSRQARIWHPKFIFHSGRERRQIWNDSPGYVTHRKFYSVCKTVELLLLFSCRLNRRWRQFLIHRLLPHLPPPIITTTIDQVTVDTEVDTTVVVAAITEGMPTDIATATIITFGTEITSTSSITIINFLILLDDRHSLSIFQCIWRLRISLRL